VVYPSVPVRTLSVMDNPASPATNNPDPPINDSKPVRYSFLIVAGFSDPEQASRVAEEFAGKYNADMFVLPPAANGYYRFSQGRNTTAGEIRAALETLKQTYFPDVWLLTSK